MRSLSRGKWGNIAFAIWVVAFLSLLFVVVRWGHA